MNPKDQNQVKKLRKTLYPHSKFSGVSKIQKSMFFAARLFLYISINIGGTVYSSENDTQHVQMHVQKTVKRRWCSDNYRHRENTRVQYL